MGVSYYLFAPTFSFRLSHGVYWLNKFVFAFQYIVGIKQWRMLYKPIVHLGQIWFCFWKLYKILLTFSLGAESLVFVNPTEVFW